MGVGYGEIDKRKEEIGRMGVGDRELEKRERWKNGSRR